MVVLDLIAALAVLCALGFIALVFVLVRAFWRRWRAIDRRLRAARNFHLQQQTKGLR